LKAMGQATFEGWKVGQESSRLNLGDGSFYCIYEESIYMIDKSATKECTQRFLAAQKANSASGGGLGVELDHARELERLGLAVLALNVGLMLVKILAGWAGNSSALMADGVESAGDLVTTMIIWAGFRASLKPADDGHPFGHGKIEPLAGMFSGAVLCGSGVLIALYALSEMRGPSQRPEWFTLPVLLLVVIVKEGLFRRVIQAGKDADSTALQGDAWHHRSDALSSAVAAVGITMALLGGPGWEQADEWAALAACGIILLNGGRIIALSTHDILDGRVPEAMSQSIATTARGVIGVVEVETCRVRKSGVGFFVELHIEVDPDISVREGHSIAHRVKDALRAQNSRVLDVVVHVEPASSHTG